MKMVGVVVRISLLAVLGGGIGLAACSSSANPDPPALESNGAPVGNPNGKAAGGECTSDNDCMSGSCLDAKCTAPTKGVGHGCSGPADCESKVCSASMCQPIKADDGVQNGDESDVDCGGTLNCVAYPMLAAFCAWDGGRLETNDEFNAAFGAATYPWGNSPAAGGYATIGGTWQLFGPGAALQANQAACPSCNPNYANWNHNYQLPAGGNAAKPWDYAYWISPPGRFPLGANSVGHQDLAGSMLEITATVTGTQTAPDLNGQSTTQAKLAWSKNGSWEGHRIGNTTFEFAVMTKYGKTGGRCARD